MQEEVKSTHERVQRRLKESFRHWHSAANYYSNPEEFRIALNACIQSLRNVTFVLQKNKKFISNFDEWYSNWQQFLKSDPIMDWCVRARNKIVKAEDLETNSVATVSLYSSYLNPLTKLYEVNPFLNGASIAQFMREKVFSEELYQYGYLRVEKQWIDSELTEIELLDALSHAFTVLHALCEDIASQEGPKKIYTDDIDVTDKFIDAIDKIDPENKPSCMHSFVDYRTTWLKLSTGEIANIIRREKQPHVDPENIKKRYDIESVNLSQSESDLKSLVSNLLYIGMRILEVDGYHVPMIFLTDRKNRKTIYQTRFDDQEDKYLFWEEMKKEVKRKKGKSIIVISEIWLAPFDPDQPSRRPSDSPERQEALQAVGATKSGEFYSLFAPFTREDDIIVFDRVIKDDHKSANFLQPILRLWKRQRKLNS